MMSDFAVQPVAEQAPQPGPGLSQWQRVVCAFTAPSKTFEDIKAGHTSWWLPFLLFVIVGTGLWSTVTYKVTWPQVQDNSVRMSAKTQAQLETLKPEQREAQKKVGVIIQQYLWLLAPVWVLVLNLIAAGILIGTINFGFGGKAKFGQVLAVAWFAGLPGLIKLLIGLIGLLAGVTPEAFLPQNPAGTNPGYFMAPPPETSTALWGLLVALDVITIWTLVLWSKGLAKVAGVKPSAGYIAVFGWWILSLLISAGFSAAFS
jgi:hypothetical protein